MRMLIALVCICTLGVVLVCIEGEKIAPSKTRIFALILIVLALIGYFWSLFIY